ncbi:MAG: MFS transporter [Propionibacteriaceae bacterium]
MSMESVAEEAAQTSAPVTSSEEGAVFVQNSLDQAPEATLSELWTNRSFLLVWVGRNFCRLGDSIHEVALAWVVYKLTGSALAMGAMLAVTALPQVLLLLLGGMVSDRLSRRKILLVTDGLSAVAVGMLAFLWWQGLLTLPVILVTTCMMGALSAFYGPAYAPLLGDVVPERLIPRANAVDGATFSIMTMAGPALGGLLAVWSPTFALAFNAFTFAVSFVFLWALNWQRAGGVELDKISWEGLKESFDYVMKKRWLLNLGIIFAAINLFCVSPYYVLLPRVIAHQGLSGEAYGLVLGAQGLFSVVCSLVLAKYEELRRPALTASAGAISMCGGAIFMGSVTDNPAAILFAGSLLGASVLTSTVLSILLQTVVDGSVRGRAINIIQLMALAPSPLGYLAASWGRSWATSW